MTNLYFSNGNPVISFFNISNFNIYRAFSPEESIKMPKNHCKYNLFLHQKLKKNQKFKLNLSNFSQIAQFSCHFILAKTFFTFLIYCLSFRIVYILSLLVF
jgi:hypothetical protein